MAVRDKQIRILILDDNEILRFLYSVAFARATLEDLRIVIERNAFDIPGPIGNAERIVSASEGNPLAIKMKAMEYYSMYVQGFHNRQAQSVEQTHKFLHSIAERRVQYQQAMSRLNELVSRHNNQLIDFFTSAAATAIKVRTFGTVAMTTISAVAAVAGAAAAAPIGLIYVGAKVVGGGGAGLASSGDGWGTAQAVALGKYENGVISVGEYSQPYVDDTLSALSKSWEAEVARQVSSKSKVVIQLQQQVAAQTKALAGQIKVRDVAGTARALRTVRATNLALQTERQAAYQTFGAGLARQGLAQTVRRGIPVISAVNDLFSAYGDYYEDMAKLESRR